MRRLFLIAVGLMSIIPFAATVIMAAPEPLTCGMPKIQSFDFLLDCSGSMMMRHKHLGRNKFGLAKQILRRVNDRIPELGYPGSIHTFGDNKQVLAPQTYRREIFQNTFDSLKDTYEVFNRLTPMGDGINLWSKALYAGMPSPAAVIIVSDGESNRGTNPLAAAQAAMAANSGLVFHIISLADSPDGQAVLDSIVALQPYKSVSVRAENMLDDDDAVKRFVMRIYCAGSGGYIHRRVEFAFNSAKLTRETEYVLDEFVNRFKRDDRLMQHTQEISGHTCNIGSDAQNQRLSERRAAVVKAYLVKQGIPESVLITRGYGASMPKESNDHENGRRTNRRVDISWW